MKTINRFSIILAVVVMLGLADVKALSLPDSPLFLDVSVPPNVILTYDDSGSMAWGYLPDSICGTYNTKRGKSSTFNLIYYNPNITYSPGVDKDGNSLGNANFISAWEDGYTKTGVLNLSSYYVAGWNNEQPYCGAPITAPDPTGNNNKAYYYRFDNLLNDGDISNDNNYTLIQVSTSEEQNFANWYSYYRSRKLIAKNAAGRVFNQSSISDGKLRLAYQRLNSCTSLGTNPSASCPGYVVKSLEDNPLLGLTTRTDFFNWLYTSAAGGGTPLINATVTAGNYLKQTDANGPWAENPGVSIGSEFSCRQNFHVMFTDGMWSYNGQTGNLDSASTTFPNGQVYTPGSQNQKIYPDGNSNYLADAAFKFWKEDARTDLADNVPTNIVEMNGTPSEVFYNPVNDPANWQHLVEFPVGFGVTGNLIFPGDYNDLVTGIKTWGSNKADDLWHTAVNSRGKYFTASDPNALTIGLKSAFNEILARTSSGASAATNSSSLGTGSRLYQSKFTSGIWTGQVLAFDLDISSGRLITPEVWEASTLLNTLIVGNGWDQNRSVITYDGINGIPFRWTSLSSAQQTKLNTNSIGVVDGEGAARLEYVRGNSQNEGVKYRPRVSKLGDTINSAPILVGESLFNYPDTLESTPYSTFASNNKTRTPILYIGANDGMLHAFNASTGNEVFAYVPESIYSNLSALTSTNYQHKFFVDGTPTVGDAFNGLAWRTVLVGGLRKGGQAIYALDITNPLTLNEANANTTILWEFNDADDSDLGYTYSQPAVVRMRNGKWAAVFGNGYNSIESDGSVSSTGNAVLYIVDVFTGGLIKKIDTGTGNGLATAAPVDTDGDRIIDFIYAGDLQGNLWKFDVRSNDPAMWDISYGGPLFSATDSNGTIQPITTRPEVSKHPTRGFMIYFGTGKYLEFSDNTSSGQTQTFYGIWDDNAPVADTDLLLQSILGQEVIMVNGVSVEARVTTGTQIDWASDKGWFIDLTSMGERQITNPILRDGRIIFTTMIPSSSPCVFGGSGFLMELNSLSGNRLNNSPFDFDQDGVFDLVDLPSLPGGPTVPSGVSTDNGAPSAPMIIADPDNGREYKYISGTNDAKLTIIYERPVPPQTKASGRMSWRQLK